MNVGSIIKEYRKKRGLSLRKTAELAGISAPTLSQIEHNNTSPNLTTLKKIAEVLGVSVISILSQEEKQSVSLLRKENREKLVRNATEKGDILEEFLVEKRDIKMEAAMISLPPGAECIEYVSHDGEEFALVVKGSVELDLEGYGQYILEEGDTLYYPCSIPHCFRNVLDNEESKFLFVATPPNY